MSEYKSDIPWSDTKKWTYGKWYPLPFGYMERDNKGWIHEGWGIYRLEDDDTVGDIYPICATGLQFSTAVKICEAKNGERFIELGKP